MWMSFNVTWFKAVGGNNWGWESETEIKLALGSTKLVF